MRVFSYICFYLFFALFSIHKAQASHVRAGEITAVRDTSGGNQTSLKYIFTFTLYRDAVDGVPVGVATLFFGDGTNSGSTPPPPGEDIGNATEKYTFIFTHTYTAPSAYTIYVTVLNRNAGVLNMENSNNTTFRVETKLLISSSVGINNTPILRYPPVDLARVGQRYTHNADAFDIDGDSLAYRLTVPKQGQEEKIKSIDVYGYKDPHLVEPLGRSENDGPATFSINAFTGDLVWDSPNLPGEYNVAFVIEEWRGGVKIGEVVRDMQIIVKDNPNNRPNLVIPNDTCIVAGSFLPGTITATDQDNNRIRLSSSSGLYQPNFPSPLAKFTVPAAIQNNPATGTFSWQSECVHVREQPYQVLFKAEDLPSDTSRKLVDIKVWQITVVGPRPTGLAATAQGTSMQLSWDAYTCSNAKEMIIYRKVGCSEIDTSTCNTGLAGTGYVEIGRVPIGTTAFIDNNAGQGLSPGISYSYRLVAGFAPPQGGLSLASKEACVSLLLDMPFLTHVSVEKTAVSQGEILVKWMQPLELDQKTNPGPYRYELYRANGLSGGSLQGPIRTVTVNSISPATDTIFRDSALNTQDSAYHYVLLFYTGGGILKDSTQAASSVRLSLTPAVNSIELGWQAIVPWSNQGTIHKVYRESRTRKGEYTFLADVAVGTSGSFKFTDTGNGLVLDEDSSYCYYVETYGSYGNAKIISPLINKSQIACAAPLDTLRPCPPLLAIDLLDCSVFEKDPKAFCQESSFTNKLTWTPAVGSAVCDEDVVSYRLYYKRYAEDTDYALVATIAEAGRLYLHEGLTSYAGCYYMTAVDEDGQESLPSNEVCKDNCPYYVLPNVITPNGDNKNELLRPFDCPRFVQAVEISIYNRWGRPIFESDDNILINWDGRLSAGEAGEPSGQVSGGVYYYEAQVRFSRLSRKEEQVRIKGWIHVLK